MRSRPEDREVAVCRDNEGYDPIEGLRVMSISTNTTARMISHPVESGGVTFDNKVREPIEIEVKCAVEWANRAVLDEVDAMWMNKTYQFYSVVARDATYVDLALCRCPNTQTPQKFDVFDLTLSFKEVMFGEGPNAESDDAANSPTQMSGGFGG